MLHDSQIVSAEKQKLVVKIFKTEITPLVTHDQ